MLAGLGVSSIGTSGSYCSIDEYCRRCDPQGTKGSSGDATQGGSTGGGLGGMGMVTKDDSSTSGGLGGIGMETNGDGFTKGGKSSGTGATWGGGVVTGTDDSGSGMTTVDPPAPPEGLGLSMNIGVLLLSILLRFLRSVWGSLRNVWSFRV